MPDKKATWDHISTQSESQHWIPEIHKLIKIALEKHPMSGYLYKEVCLFFERERQLETAIEICKEAISKGIRDGTKNGFEGRLKRLMKNYNSAHPCAK
jgi:hypothetical protein